MSAYSYSYNHFHPDEFLILSLYLKSYLSFTTNPKYLVLSDANFNLNENDEYKLNSISKYICPILSHIGREGGGGGGGGGEGGGGGGNGGFGGGGLGGEGGGGGSVGGTGSTTTTSGGGG